MQEEQSAGLPGAEIIDAPSEPPAWPKVIGWISIVWAGLWLLCGLCGVVSLAFMPQMLKSAEAQLGPMPDVMKPELAQMVLSGISLIGPIILLAAGISTISRKAIGRSLHLAYAAFSILLAIPSGYVAVTHQLKLEAWAAANQADKWAKQAGSPLAWVFIVLGFGIGVIWPLFCAIWFGAAKKKPDDGYSPLDVV